MVQMFVHHTMPRAGSGSGPGSPVSSRPLPVPVVSRTNSGSSSPVVRPMMQQALSLTDLHQRLRRQSWTLSDQSPRSTESSLNAPNSPSMLHHGSNNDSLHEDELDASQLLHDLSNERDCICKIITSEDRTDLDLKLDAYSARVDALLSSHVGHEAHGISKLVRDARQSVIFNVENMDESHRTGSVFFKAAVAYNTICNRVIMMEKNRLEALLSSSPLVKTKLNLMRLREAVAQTQVWLCNMCLLSDEELNGMPRNVATHIMLCLNQQRATKDELRNCAPVDLQGMLATSFAFDSSELGDILLKIDCNLQLDELKTTFNPPTLREHFVAYTEKVLSAELLIDHQLNVAHRKMEITSRMGKNVVVDALAALNELILTPRDHFSPRSYKDSEIEHSKMKAHELRVAYLKHMAVLNRAKALNQMLEQMSGDTVKETLVSLLNDAMSLPTDVEAAGDPAKVGFINGREEAISEEGRLINKDDLNLLKSISHGSQGVAFEATWQGAIVHALIPSRSFGDEESLQAEITKLSVLRHCNIVSVLGVVAEPPTYCLVLQHFDGVSVQSALKNPTEPGFFWATAQGTASGMSHLHSRNVLHGDLSTKNILVNHSRQVKLTGFGLPFKTTFTSSNSHRCLMPEELSCQEWTKAADVFSFSFVLYELVTHLIPCPNQATMPMLDSIWRKPLLSQHVPTDIAKLIKSCWQDVPSLRPTFDSVYQVQRVVPSWISLMLQAISKIMFQMPEDQLARSTLQTLTTMPLALEKEDHIRMDIDHSIGLS